MQNNNDTAINTIDIQYTIITRTVSLQTVGPAHKIYINTQQST